MPEMSSYEHGVPCWVDVASPDTEASKGFYHGLFGWGAYTDPDPQYGGYTQLLLDGAEGRPAAGLMSIMTEQQPPAWTCYVSVSDADGIAKAVQGAGGQILVEPMNVGSQGRMGVFLDDQGAAFGVWQPMDFHGATVVNEPNTFCWSEFACRDSAAGQLFYTEVFGWEAETSAFGETTYTEFKVGGRSIAGMLQMNEQWPADVPPHWMVYFAVADCDAAAAKVTELGGAVPVAPTDIPIGRFAVVNDAHGAHFSIIKLAG